MDEEGEAEHEGQMHHSEGMSLQREDGGVKGPGHESNVEKVDDHGEFPFYLSHPCLPTELAYLDGGLAVREGMSLARDVFEVDGI